MRSPSGRRCASFHRIAAYFSMVMTLSVRSIILPILVVRLSGAAGDDAVLLANIAQARQASIEETPVETIRIQGGRAALKFLVCRHFGRSYARQIPVRIDGADIWFGNKRVVGKASGRHEACKEQSNNDNFRSGPHKLLRPFTHADATTHQSYSKAVARRQRATPQNHVWPAISIPAWNRSRDITPNKMLLSENATSTCIRHLRQVTSMLYSKFLAFLFCPQRDFCL